MRAVSFAVLAFCTLAQFTLTRAQTLEGAIDLHAHAAPDGTPRKLDALDLARMAKAAGMRAIVIKNCLLYTSDAADDLTPLRTPPR